MDRLIGVLLTALGLYAALGVLFALAFVTLGAPRVDHNARGGPVGFRMMILPGSAALWPVLLVKWLRAGKGARA